MGSREAKSYLKQIKLMNERIFTMQMEIQRIRAESASLGSVDYSADKVQSSGNDRLSNLITLLVDKEAELYDVKIAYESIRSRIISEIQSLKDDRYVKILWCRYVECMIFEDIAETMGYDIRHCIRLHGEALNAFDERVLKCHNEE